MKTFGFDAAGNTTSAGTQTFGYDGRGRLVSANTALGAVSYQVNALGQRVAKQAPEGTTVFHYDREGRIIAESDAAGNVQREYVWLGAQPVAMLTAGQVYYVHADHLDTPRVVTNHANTIVWRWDSDPFGTTPPNEDPDGDGQSFVFNLRLPGQYFDKETGLHYNYFRDYDPQTGRYVQSDPIGLKGGINTYGYVDGNPVSKIDPTGVIPSGADPECFRRGECRCATPECAAGLPQKKDPPPDPQKKCRWVCRSVLWPACWGVGATAAWGTTPVFGPGAPWVGKGVAMVCNAYIVKDICRQVCDEKENTCPVPPLPPIDPTASADPTQDYTF